MKKKVRILITNDDGVNAPGIKILAETLKEFGNVTIVAPDSARSGASSQITTTLPLQLLKMEESENFSRYRCTGTPVDCIKIALNQLFQEDKPNLIVSGINHGRNDGICVIYSGTVGAAIEGCVAGIPSLAISHFEHGENLDFTYSVSYAKSVILWMLSNSIPKHTLLNLNIPKEKPLGLRICPQGVGRFTNEIFVSTNGVKPVFWLSGEQEKTENTPNTDFDLLSQGYATLTPLRIDLTDYNFLETFKNFQEDIFEEI